MKKTFGYFLFYNLFFFLLQTLLLIHQGQSFVSALPLPRHVYWELGYTYYIQGFLCFLLSVIQAILCQLCFSFRPQSALQSLRITIFLTTSISLLSIHTAVFPLSHYSQAISGVVPFVVILLSGFVSTFILSAIVCYTLFHLCRYSRIYFSLLFLSFLFFQKTPHEAVSKTEAQMPNVFIIGIDSLHPKFIDPKRTPTLWAFTHENIWFEETISPLARTYPAWSTILSGLHPFHHGARYNLIPKDKAASASIAWLMKKAQFATRYATDDRRFNLIDESFGFDAIIGPKIGINDMLMGTFNDFLLGNFFINGTIGRWFFPYNHMNRASHFSYYPETFDKALKNAMHHQKTQSLFMAVHFTLPHWPYAYANSKHPSARDEHNISERIPLYQKALHRVDEQIHTFLDTLEKQHFLENAWVIVLSDHGETLYTSGSRPLARDQYQGNRLISEPAVRSMELTKQSNEIGPFESYLKQHTGTALDRSAGHGSDLLSPDQFHCLLALQHYQAGKAQYAPMRIQERVSLEDIAPTISDYLHLSSKSNFDGISLRARIEKKEPLPNRAFILESGMFPNQFLSRTEAKRMGSLFFDVDERARLHIRQDKLATLDKQKLYAILKDDWILAFYPNEKTYIPVLQNIKTGKWTDYLSSPFARKSPVMSLRVELREFYAKADFVAF